MKKWAFLGFTLLLAIAVRVYALGQIPIELNRDESSLGYTAYSLLKTGREEHGTPWPVQIESFGDWKLPLYVYMLMPFVQLFGLENWVIRLPSMLAGLSVVVSSFFLIQLLIKEAKTRATLEKWAPLLLAVSPWEVHFSHVAYEAHLSLAFFLWGLIGVLAVLRDFSAHKQRRTHLLALSLTLWALTLLGYHSYQVFVPVFLIACAWLYRQEWRAYFKEIKPKLALVILPFVLVGGLLLSSGAQTANSTKFQALSIFNLKAYTKSVDIQRAMLPSLSNPLFLVTVNKLDSFAKQVQDNLFNLVSPHFLFISGGGNHSHNITGYGNMYPILFFGLVVGVAVAVIQRKQWQMLLLLWVVAASIAPMITFEANHTTRFSPGFVPIEILSAFGWFVILNALRKKTSRKMFTFILWAFAIGLSYSVYRFLVHYYFVYPRSDAQYWPWQMRSIVSYVEMVKDEYDAVYVQDEKYSPYIYFLVQEPADPATLHDRIEYYPVDAEGFHHVRRLDNIYFQRIEWNNEVLYAGKRVLIVVEEGQIPDFNRQQATTRLLTPLKHEFAPRGMEFWEYQGQPE